MIKPRKLNNYYQFDIHIEPFTNYKGDVYFTVSFLRLGEYKFNYKLTPAQWLRAKKYLSRELIPFQGYTYKVKDEYKKAGTYKII